MGLYLVTGEPGGVMFTFSKDKLAVLNFTQTPLEAEEIRDMILVFHCST